MNRCQRCLIPDSRPDTFFRDGVCSACDSYIRRDSIDWEARHFELLEILEAHNNRCIVASSGGKDSTYQALTLKGLGAQVTAVTATTCMLSEIGKRNIENLARHVRTVEITPNMTTRAKLNRIGLEMVGDISYPEHVSIHRVPFRAARDLRHTLLFYGECPLNQYGSPPGLEETRAMTQRYVSEFGGFLGLRTSDVVGMEGITDADMLDYEAPTDAELAKSGIEAYFLGWFLPWDSTRNATIAAEHGFEFTRPSQANWWRFENQDNVMTRIHDWFGWLKYGLDRSTAQLSVDVRAGVLTREDALAHAANMEGRFPIDYLGVHIDVVLARIDMTRERFVEIANRYVNREIFEGDVVWGEWLRPRESLGYYAGMSPLTASRGVLQRPS